MTEAEWHGRAHFAEIAETLGIPTDLIMAVNVKDEKYLVLFAPDYREGDPMVWSVRMERDSGGIIQQVTIPKKEPELTAKIGEILDG